MVNVNPFPCASRQLKLKICGERWTLIGASRKRFRLIDMAVRQCRSRGTLLATALPVKVSPAGLEKPLPKLIDDPPLNHISSGLPTLLFCNLRR